MERIISARHFHLRESTRQFIDERLDALEGECGRLTSARVVLDHQRNWFFAEIILHGPQLEIEAKAKADDLTATIDGAMEKAARQLRRELDKRSDHQRPSVSQLEALNAEQALSDA